MKNLNEVIAHCEHIARTNGDKECRDYHEQLAAWLKDYRKIKSKSSGRKEYKQKMSSIMEKEYQVMMTERSEIDIYKCL